MSWHQRAACIGAHELMFREDADGIEEAKALCAMCPVRASCLAEALATDPSQDFHTWGGTTEKERRALRRRTVTVQSDESDTQEDCA